MGLICIANIWKKPFSEWDRCHYPWCKAGCKNIRISLQETFGKKFRSTLAAKCYLREQSHISKALLCTNRAETSSVGEMICAAENTVLLLQFFSIYSQGIPLVSSVSPALTHFLYAFDKCDCASRSAAASLALKAKGRAHNRSQAAWPPGPSINHSNYSGQHGHC